MKRLFVILVCISLLFLSACNLGNDSISKDERLGIRGTVTNITKHGEEITLLVEGELQEDTDYDKAYVRITSDTQIFEGSNEVQADSIEIGDVVEVKFDGEVKESYLVQGSAKILVIIEKV